MTHVILHLNYLHVLVVTIAGYILGCLWSHGPLFGNAWLVEMKLTKESMEAALRQHGMAKFFLRSFGLTLLSTFGLAALVAAHGTPNWLHGVTYGAFIGLFGPGMRMLNSAAWENQSFKLQAINLSQEVAIYALQGAILGAWR
ncbi:MAG TPA: DUF1761 domain-containing protein [Lacunisphaera sp.]|nr:DUF1761 domain-containing protein [Lacunisphaera sp.]